MKNLFRLVAVSILPLLKRCLAYIAYFIFIFTIGKLKIKKYDELEKWRTLNRVSFYKTIYFNLRSLSLRDAFRFPILIYTNTSIISSVGKIKLNVPTIKFGLVRWGMFNSFRSQGKTLINNNGTIIINGKGVFLMGSDVSVFKDALLQLGNEFFIGENVKIYAQRNITFEDYVRVSYQCDICDSDFHYIIDVNNGYVGCKYKAIYIGAYNWIGNKTTIKKGTKTPHHTMVASSYSVLSKDYTKIVEPYSVLGGCPAKVIKSNVSRVWYDEQNIIKRFDIMLRECDHLEMSKIDVEKLVEDEGC